MWWIIGYAFQLSPRPLLAQEGAEFFVAGWGMVTLCAVVEALLLARCRRVWPKLVLPTAATVFLIGSVFVAQHLDTATGNIWNTFGAAILDVFAVYALLGALVGAIGWCLWRRFHNR